MKINTKIIDYINSHKDQFELIPELDSVWEIKEKTKYPNVNCGNPIVELINAKGEWLRLPAELVEERGLTEQEIFEKLKDALDNHYLYDSWDWSDDPKEVDNLEDYLRIIKQERALEKDLDDAANDELKTHKEFIKYLADRAVGDTTDIIEEFNNCTFVRFVGYKKVTKEIIDNDLYIHFIVDETKLKAKWQTIDNYAVWQISGYLGDDYSGYMLFPTYDDNEYFCLEYKC
jgi:hypothetical protein